MFVFCNNAKGILYMKDDYKKFNRNYVLKRVTINIVLSISSLFIMYFFFNDIIPKIVSLDNKVFKVFFIFVIIYIVVRNYFSYKGLLVHLNRSDNIYEIKSEENVIGGRSPKNNFYYLSMLYAESLEVIKTKIDILKSLVPVPIIVLLLGLLLNSDTNILVNEILSTFDNLKNMKFNNLNIKEIMLLSIIFLIFYYCYEFVKTWFYYKATLNAYYSYKFEYDVLEKEIDKKVENKN